MPHRRQRNDKDNDEGYECHDILCCPPQRPHLAGLQRFTEDGLENELYRVLYVLREELRALDVE